MDQKPPQMTMVKCLIRLESRICRLTKQVNFCSINIAEHVKPGGDLPDDLLGDSGGTSRKFYAHTAEAPVKEEAEDFSTLTMK